MSVKTAHLSIENYSEKQKRSLQRLLDSLAKSENRLAEHYSQVRTHQRQRCHNLLYLQIPQPHEKAETFTVCMRDISSSGTSFVYPGELESRTLLVGIPIPGREPTWFQGVIVRSKQISDEEFWDYGVQFKGRLT